VLCLGAAESHRRALPAKTIGGFEHGGSNERIIILPLRHRFTLRCTWHMPDIRLSIGDDHELLEVEGVPSTYQMVSQSMATGMER
jgi:hypothetical protein